MPGEFLVSAQAAVGQGLDGAPGQGLDRAVDLLDEAQGEAERGLVEARTEGPAVNGLEEDFGSHQDPMWIRRDSRSNT